MIDLTKPVQTRSGCKVRLYNADNLDGTENAELHGAIELPKGWLQVAWDKKKRGSRWKQG